VKCVMFVCVKKDRMPTNDRSFSVRPILMVDVNINTKLATRSHWLKLVVLTQFRIGRLFFRHSRVSNESEKITRRIRKWVSWTVFSQLERVVAFWFWPTPHKFWPWETQSQLHLLYEMGDDTKKGANELQIMHYYPSLIAYKRYLCFEMNARTIDFK
jgi:hypothetical protein